MNFSYCILYRIVKSALFIQGTR